MIPSPLMAWIERKAALPKRVHAEVQGESAFPWPVWVTLEQRVSLHEAAGLKWQGLKRTRQMTDAYLDQASRLIDSEDEGLWGSVIDSEESALILEELGPPPELCLPIYLITVGESTSERVVYVGKTATESRFKGGHHAALQLHAPAYEHQPKSLYRCSVTAFIDNEHRLLEWFDLELAAIQLLDRIESVLIHGLLPELNRSKRRLPCTQTHLDIHIQNFSGTSLLNDAFFFHRDGQPMGFSGRTHEFFQ